MADIVEEGQRLWELAAGGVEFSGPEAVLNLGKWADENLPSLFFRLSEAEYRLGRIAALFEDMSPETEDSIREIMGLPIPVRDGD